MGISSAEFVKEIQQMVRRKHSKDHPIIDLIEAGKLDREQLKGFIGQFYLFFPKPFPKPIAAMLSRCPDDAELEKMWIENVVEEGTGEITGTDSHKGCSSVSPRHADTARKNWTAWNHYRRPKPFWTGVSYSCTSALGWSCMHAKGFVLRAPPTNG